MIALLAILGLSDGYVLDAPHARAAAPSANVPVVTTLVERRDMSLEVKGIGTVQAYNTVVVKPLVGGQIVQVAFTEGQSVRQGTVLARIDSRFLVATLHQSQANRARDQAQLDNALRDLARLTDVAAKGYVSRQQVDAQQSQVAVLRAAIQADQAAIENAQIQVDYTTVRAPIDGVTGIRMVDVGNVISPADPGLVVITQVRPIAVIFTLPADVVAAMAIGQVHSRLPVEAFDRSDRVRLSTGTLALVDNQIDRASNTVRLKALFDNADGALRPGEFVNAHLRETVLSAVTALRKSAIQYDELGPFIWIVRSNSAVESRRVVLGSTSGDLVQVVRGVSPGDRVVLEGQYGLRAGILVTPQDRPATPAAAGASVLTIP